MWSNFKPISNLLQLTLISILQMRKVEAQSTEGIFPKVQTHWLFLQLRALPSMTFATCVWITASCVETQPLSSLASHKAVTFVHRG